MWVNIKTSIKGCPAIFFQIFSTSYNLSYGPTWFSTAQHEHGEGSTFYCTGVVRPSLVTLEIFLCDVVVIVGRLPQLHHKIQICNSPHLKFVRFSLKTWIDLISPSSYLQFRSLFAVHDTGSAPCLASCWFVGTKPSLGSREQWSRLPVCHNLCCQPQLLLHIRDQTLDGKLSDKYPDSINIIGGQVTCYSFTVGLKNKGSLFFIHIWCLSVKQTYMSQFGSSWGVGRTVR